MGERGGGLRLDGVHRGPSTAFGAECAPNSAQDDKLEQATTKCGGPSTAFDAECAPNSAQDDS